MKIGIIGGGNLGSVLAVKFSQKNDVILYTNLKDKINLYQSNMQVFCEDNNEYYAGNNIKYTTDLKQLLDNSDYIFITFPAFLFDALFEELKYYLTSKHHLVFVPGSGGAELFFKDALKKGVTITGLQRVHSVARIIEFGKLVKESGIKSKLKIASIPSYFNEQAALDLQELFNIQIEQLNNYLNVTFVNSNPILHTSRLYTLFKDFDYKTEYRKIPLFYEEWSDESSILLMDMDKELFIIINELKRMGLVVDGIIPIAKYYDSDNYSQLTNKLKSIKAFKGITTPSVLNKDGLFSPDLTSRYFTSDFPFGLDILIAYGDLLGLDLPKMKMVSEWYHKINNSKRSFDLKKFGIRTIDDLLKLYKF